MKTPTRSGSKTTQATTTGNPQRKLTSWIESFIDQTSNLHSPEIFRRWTAITTIAAALEQKVWVRTSRPLYPNIYAFIVGHPGVGKSRTMREGRSYIQELPEFHLAPISMTFASLVDSLVRSKRNIICPPDDPLEYNSMYICADELGAFMSKYDNEMIDGLSAFYDPDPYNVIAVNNKWDDGADGTFVSYFTPAYKDIGFIDENGNSLISKAKSYYDKERETASKSSDGSLILRKKAEKPYNPREATLVTSGNPFLRGELVTHLNNLLALKARNQVKTLGICVDLFNTV